MLKAENISFGYEKGKPILKNVTLEVKPGEVLGILGPSGYGKSTLAKILSGLREPDEGKVTVDEKAFCENGIFPVQLIYQHPEKSLNPRWKMKKSLTECWEPDQDMCQHFGIKKKWLNRWPNELSGGELQRFCILRVLAPQVKYIVADEISTMLDAISQVQIWEILLDIVRERNLGLIIITHSTSLAEKLCTRIINLPELQNMQE